ncbi:hypothetical protein QN277_022466 [Acacia crassicarpa]|uniref:Tf2-1-like SH3-like domain-containing protein n=1 Tax=Acacia crassicarpa TaxID=499986 RepID=A0AAE1JF47_9FABA|nr:hypothetical protein QN277_022466 [Acacia crassicarpa]
MTPFRAVYGRDPPTFLKLTNEPSVIEEVNEQLRSSRNAIIATLKENLLNAQEEMRRQANKHCRDIQFGVGDQVYVKIRPYRLCTLAKRINEKLSPRFYKPFMIVERVGTVAYRLELPPTAQVHQVFHISVLKKSVQFGLMTPTIPPTLSDQLEPQVQAREGLQD